MNSEFLIDLTIYICFGMGCVLFMWSDIEFVIARCKLRHRLKALKVEQKKLPGPLNYVDSLISVSFEKDSSKRLFLIFEFLLFLISYVLSYRNFSPLCSAMVSLITVALPMLLLASKLEAGRAKASKEGISLVSELHRQYRINNLNIYEAIEDTVSAEGDYKLSSKYLYSLLIRLRTSCGPVELRDAIDRFVFSFGTSWAKMLGQCIRISAENGTDVSAGLADIAYQLKEAYNLEEKRRMMNSEASRMTLLLIPLMYIACMATAVFYIGISPTSLLKNQFLDPKGYLLFLLIVLLFIINFLILSISGSNKLDY